MTIKHRPHLVLFSSSSESTKHVVSTALVIRQQSWVTGMPESCNNTALTISGGPQTAQTTHNTYLVLFSSSSESTKLVVSISLLITDDAGPPPCRNRGTRPPLTVCRCDPPFGRSDEELCWRFCDDAMNRHGKTATSKWTEHVKTYCIGIFTLRPQLNSSQTDESTTRPEPHGIHIRNKSFQTTDLRWHWLLNSQFNNGEKYF